jgi:hypothetical protein
VLYYAGRKGESFVDVDGDGRMGVDVAYSVEDGADTWQVDCYRWDGTRYAFSGARSRPGMSKCCILKRILTAST